MRTTIQLNRATQLSLQEYFTKKRGLKQKNRHHFVQKPPVGDARVLYATVWLVKKRLDTRKEFLSQRWKRRQETEILWRNWTKSKKRSKLLMY